MSPTRSRSDFRFRRSYVGGIRAVVLDWSGTTADAYVIAPAVVFVEVFARKGVNISMTQARGPMGLRKDLHIQALTEEPEIRAEWRRVHGGSDPTAADVRAMFDDFVPAQVACLPQYAALLPGVAVVTQALQGRGIKLGVTTGFTRVMVDVLEKHAAEQGFVPDASVAGDEVANGARPKPHMVYRNLDLLDVAPIEAVVKVDDTVGGVGEGLNAGCWAVGVSRYSNYMDIDSYEHAASLSDEEIDRRNRAAAARLVAAGAHYVIDSIVELPAVIDDIEARLARGERP